MPLLEMRNVAKHYGQKEALCDISLHVNAGEIVALIGKNGAGKTTLLNSISGIIFPDSGEIFYKGIDLQKDNAKLSEFGILITGSFFDYLNTFDNLSLLMKASGENDRVNIAQKIDETLKLVGLETQKKKKVKGFSFGMKQRLGLAQTLLTKTDFLILDEPFVGLDPLGKDMLKKVIKSKAKDENSGILFSSHDLTDVTEICDRIVMIEGGHKVYDDIFDNERRYCIALTQTPDHQQVSELKAIYGESISLSDNTIEFRDVELSGKIMDFLTKAHIKVSKMEVKENSLYDFFKEEVKS